MFLEIINELFVYLSFRVLGVIWASVGAVEVLSEEMEILFRFDVQTFWLLLVKIVFLIWVFL